MNGKQFSFVGKYNRKKDFMMKFFNYANRYLKALSKYILILLFIFGCFITSDKSFSKGRLKKDGDHIRMYFTKMYGNIHRNPSPYSSSLTTISCGKKVLVKKARADSKKHWRFLKVGPYKGYILNKFLSKKKPKCFQTNYPYFYESFDIDLSDMFFWGRLYDQYILGGSGVKR